MALTILVGFADSFSAIEVVWSLQQAGFSVAALNRAGSRPAARRIRGINLIDVTDPGLSVSRCVDDISSVIDQVRPAAFLPLDDASLWLVDRIDWKQCLVVGPPAPARSWALDKAAQLRTASANGLDVPETVVITEPSGLDSVALPRILKPAPAIALVADRLTRPTGYVCADAAELAKVRTRLTGFPLLCQAIKSGTGEGIFGYVGPEGPTAWSAHRRVRMVNPQGSASSACESIDPDPELVTKVSMILKDLDWNGLFMAEFLRDRDGRPWFMEVNGRAWGSMALARRRGLEYPTWAAQQSLGLPIEPALPTNAAYVRCRHAGREILHAAFVWRGPQSDAVASWPGRGRTLRDLLTIQRHDRWYNWDRTQPTVLIADTWQALDNQIRNRKRP